MTLRTRWLVGGAAGSLLILLLGFLLIINPAREHLDAVNAAVAEQYAENERMAVEVERRKAQVADIPATVAEVEQVRTKMPADMEQPSLVRALEAAAATSGVDVKRISADTPRAVEGSPGDTELVALPYSITATGSYAALKTYVSELERLQRVFLITDFEIGSGKGSFGDLTMNLDGTFYSLQGYGAQAPQNLPPAGVAPDSGTEPSGQAAAKTAKRDTKKSQKKGSARGPR